jgi:hypothetical protein
MKINLRSFVRRVLERPDHAEPQRGVELDDVAVALARTDATLRALRALERDDLVDACREAVAAEDAAAGLVRCRPEHDSVLAAADRRIAAQWRLVWGDPPTGVEPRKAGAWAELRTAQVLRDLAAHAGGNVTGAEARLKAAKDALVHVLPTRARKVAAEILG